MSWSYYTLADAQAVLGKRVRTHQPYFLIPAGTTGTVVRLDTTYASQGDYGVIVQWDLPPDRDPAIPPESTFTPAQYKWALVETG